MVMGVDQVLISPVVHLILIDDGVLVAEVEVIPAVFEVIRLLMVLDFFCIGFFVVSLDRGIDSDVFIGAFAIRKLFIVFHQFAAVIMGFTCFVQCDTFFVCRIMDLSGRIFMRIVICTAGRFLV